MKIRLSFCTLAFLLISGLCNSVSAQRSVVLNMPMYDHEKLNFGFVLGVNVTNVSIKPISDLRTKMFNSTFLPDILPTPDSARVLAITSTPVPGFVVSIFGKVKVGKYFEIQFVPTLSFGDRTLNYDLQTFHLHSGGKDTIQFLTILKKVPSTYVSFPFEIKYKALRYNNFRPYLLGGVQYSLDLASNAKKREQNNRNEKIVKFNANDVYLEAGVGFDFFNEWFKLGIELKMMYGLMDVLKHENNIYTESISSLNSKIFQLSFTFE